MRILITNDDGIHAEGLVVLESIARALSDDVWVVAPETDQSGLAHSLTLSQPLRSRQIAEKKFAISGTPTDCVIMGVSRLLPGKPDLVLSGVNSGQNAADDVTYSGTVAGAIEGTLLGIKSIALSQAYDWYDGKRHVIWQTSQTHAVELIKKLIDIEFPKDTLINVNFPNCQPEEVEGAVVTAQGKLNYGLSADERLDGRGFPYYWLKFSRRTEGERKNTDTQALANNKISITPLKLDLTDYSFKSELAKRLEE